ncbi:MAG: hypothetical protein PHO83_03875 [Geobacteraceae bacterium]|nr:hypothetical protein [Geobacteraceae bacterium]
MFFRCKNPQKLTLGAASVASDAVGEDFVVIRPTVNIFFAYGAAPVAAVNGDTCHFLFAGEAFGLRLDDPAHKIAAIPETGTSGAVYLSSLGSY